MSLIAITILLFEAASTFVLGGTLGKPPLQYNATIKGGYNASIENFPYQVAMYYNGEYECSGSIISEYYILTTTGCINDKEATDIVIHLGSTFRDNGTVMPIDDTFEHPEYPNINVGLMKTKDPIKFTSVIKPIKLPPRNRTLKDGSTITVSGWGARGDSNNFVQNLQAIDLLTVNFDNCKASLVYLYETNFCAGGLPSGGKGMCRGDFGNPAVQDNILVGIASYVLFTCAQPNIPDVFVNIAHPDVRDFITKHTGL